MRRNMYDLLYTDVTKKKNLKEQNSKLEIGKSISCKAKPVSLIHDVSICFSNNSH